MKLHYRPFKVVNMYGTYYCMKAVFPKPNDDAAVPTGETKQELIECLECMLHDAKKHRVKVEKG